MHPVQDHVHPRKVIGGAVHLLAKELGHIRLFGDAQQQGPRPAGRIIDRFQPRLAGGDDARKDGGHLVRGIELARLLARAAGEFPDQVFIGIAQNVAVGLV